MATSALALVWAGSLVEVLLYRVAFGLGMSVFAIARHAYIADFIPNAGRGRAVAIIGGIYRGGRFMGPIAAGVVAAVYGLRVPFVGMALLIGMALLVILIFMPHTSGNRLARPAGYLQGLAASLRQYWRVLGTVGIGQLLVQMVRQGRATILPLYAAEALSLDEAAIGLVVGIGAALDTLFFLPAGFIMDSFGRKWAIIPSFLIQGLGLALIPLTATFSALAAVSALIGLGNGLSAGTMLTLGADFAPEEGRGEFLGLWRTLGSAGFSTGPLAVGAVADLFTLSTAAVVLGICGVAASGLFALFVPETLRRPPRK
jgi:MFS family permease